VNFATFYIDCAERSSRAEVFACATTDAFIGVDDRYLATVIFLRLHHHDGSRRAMALAVATFDAIGGYDTVFLHPHSVADADRSLLFATNLCNGTCRTHM
jgi:hypothetical protein